MNSLRTILVTVLGILSAVFMYVMGTFWFFGNMDFFATLFAAALLIFLYGGVFWIGFILLLVSLDLILGIPGLKHLKVKLAIEWLVLSAPFFYWAALYKHQRPFYLVAIIAFLVMQVWRSQALRNKSLAPDKTKKW